MPLPFLNAPEQSIDVINQFGGYNHNLIINENEFFDMKNMSPRCFPVVATRNKRGYFVTDGLKNANAIVAKDNLYYSYTAYGDIGVKLKSAISKGDWTEPLEKDEPSGESSSITQSGITTIANLNNNDVVNWYLGHYGVSAFSRYIIQNNTMSISSGKTPVIKNQQVKMNWEHEKIPAGTLWAKSLFTLGHWYSVPKNKVSIIDNISYAMSEKYVGAELWIDGVNKVVVKSIEKTNAIYYRDAYTVTFDKELDSSVEGKQVYVRLCEPTSKEIPAGKYVVENTQGSSSSVPINPPTTVEVEALSDAHVKVLKGKTIVFKDSKGEHECKVTDYKIDGNTRKIVISRPHDAIEANATAYGDRLYLCEYNPFSGKTTVSDVFSAAAGEHTLVEMGAYICVFPEKVMINTQKRDVEGSFTEIIPMEMTETLGDEQKRVVVLITDGNGAHYVCHEGSTAPTSPGNGKGWIDISEKIPTFKIYSSQIEQWSKTQPYCELRFYNFKPSKDWKKGDAIEIEFRGNTYLDGNKTNINVIGDHIVPADEQKYFVISATGTSKDSGNAEYDYIRFPVAMKRTEVKVSEITIKRTVPDMDFVIENENRLWGCKYGVVDGEPVNEIFACKLGDPKNWHCFSNTSMDSYYVSLGSDGAFTGAISYAGSPVFFKESCVHRIYGNYPSNYTLKTVNCHGVEKGSEKGLAIMNDALFYKSPVGIMAYTGSAPINMSEPFGTEQYKNAVAGAVGNKMYFSMQDKDGNNVFFSFDDTTKTWHKEDDFRCKDMVAYENDMYALSSDNKLVNISGKQGASEDDFEWSLTSGSFGYDSPFYKHIARLNIRMELARNARASVSIQYDSDGNWYHVGNLESRGKVINSSLPVTPQRCDHFALKIEGKGEAKILSITKFVEGGSENE